MTEEKKAEGQCCCSTKSGEQQGCGCKGESKFRCTPCLIVWGAVLLLIVLSLALR